MELVSGAARTSEAEAIEAEDAFEMGEQHLDLRNRPVWAALFVPDLICDDGLKRRR